MTTPESRQQAADTINDFLINEMLFYFSIKASEVIEMLTERWKELNKTTELTFELYFLNGDEISAMVHSKTDFYFTMSLNGHVQRTFKCMSELEDGSMVVAKTIPPEYIRFDGTVEDIKNKYRQVHSRNANSAMPMPLYRHILYTQDDISHFSQKSEVIRPDPDNVIILPDWKDPLNQSPLVFVLQRDKDNNPLGYFVK